MRFLEATDVGRLAQLTAVWGVIFAVVHAYWAAGGAAGMSGDHAGTLGAQGYIAFIAVLGIAGAGGAALLLGVVFGSARWLADWSLDGDGAAGVVTTLYFLLGGLLFSTVGWRDTVARRVGARA